MQHKYMEEFQREAMIEFQKLRETLENEIEDRFLSQDEIIDNLSNTIKTFQDTMKIIGQTVIWWLQRKKPIFIHLSIYSYLCKKQ